MSSKNYFTLASTSPQRKALLARIIPTFEVLSPLYEETATHLPADQEVLQHAKAKAESILAKTASRWVLGSDTLLSYQGKKLGKPKDRNEAQQFISLLAGNTHDVWTGMALWDRESLLWNCIAEKTSVRFHPLSEAKIKSYLDTGEWQGRAGGYAYQETGHTLIASIEGEESVIIGLNLPWLQKQMKGLISF